MTESDKKLSSKGVGGERILFQIIDVSHKLLYNDAKS